MPNTLTVAIDPADVETLRTCYQRVVLLQPANSNLRYEIAWAVLPPAATIQVSWGDDHRVASSTSGVTAGQVVTAAFSAPATAGSRYTLTDAGFDTGTPVEGVGYQILDAVNRPSRIAVGLLQELTTGDGTSLLPIWMQPIMFNQLASLTATKAVQIFVASGVTCGMVLDSDWLTTRRSDRCAEVTVVAGPQLTLDFRAQTAWTATYDRATNSFVPGVRPARGN